MKKRKPQMNTDERRFRHLLRFLSVAICVHLWSPVFVAAQPCTGFDECTTNPMCMPNGTCQGTPVENGTPCNDENPCTANDACLSGTCVGNPGPRENQPCETQLGLCALDSLCHFGVCGSLKLCADADANKCTLEFCNPETGDCDFSFPVTCNAACTTGTCRPSDGVCINPTPRANGFPCNDGNTCTTGESCQGGTCIASGAATPTATRTATVGGATPTRTPTGPAATVTRTATRTLTRTPTVAACYGDCDGNGVVNSTDLNRLRSTLLRCGPCGGEPGAPAAGCTAFANGCVAGDFDHDGCVRASDLTRVVANVLDDPSGCAPSGPPVPAVARRAAGTIHSTTSVLLLLPRVVSAILGPASIFGGQAGAAAVVFDLPITCPASGGGSLKCEQDFFPGITAPIYTANLTDCVANVSNRTVKINGTLTAEGLPGDICGAVSSPLLLATDNLVIEESGAAGSLTATFDDFSVVVTLSSEEDQCFYSDFEMEPSGTLNVVTKNPGGMTLSSSQITFGAGSSVELLVTEYGDGCAPVSYVIALDGSVSLTSGGVTLQATYDGYTMVNDTGGGGNEILQAGSISSACLGGSVTVATDLTLLQAAGASCPNAGRLDLTYPLGSDALLYGASSLGIDQGNDGDVEESHGSCLADELYVCVSAP
jgi:hypothetical protein